MCDPCQSRLARFVPVTPSAYDSTVLTMNPDESQPNNPLHGVTLKAMLEHLVDVYGWVQLGDRINIRCFTHDPSLKSSLKFLRQTDWARAKVERLYLRSLGRMRSPNGQDSPASDSETTKPGTVRFKRDQGVKFRVRKQGS
ncbi:VF530 family protein [Rubripirellula amarantea]|nr:VF530 family protein [Rubripirellula amarantea]